MHVSRYLLQLLAVTECGLAVVRRLAGCPYAFHASSYARRKAQAKIDVRARSTSSATNDDIDRFMGQEELVHLMVSYH